MELFPGLSVKALADVASKGQVQTFPKETILFTQGSHADRSYAVITGRVRISQAGAEGSELLVRIIGPSEMFGTVAIFTDRRYPAEAVAVVDSIGISWTESVLLGLIHRYPQIALNLVRIVGERLREVQERLRELATQRVDRRLAHALLRLAGRAMTGEQGASIDFPITRQDLASFCGTTLYTASRVLTAWEKTGCIATHRGRLRILDLAAIRRLADDCAG
jgi:CRP/FNR family transcriptional regulator, nitrogen oxide reductase regulator